MGQLEDNFNYLQQIVGNIDDNNLGKNNIHLKRSKGGGKG